MAKDKNDTIVEQNIYGHMRIRVSKKFVYTAAIKALKKKFTKYKINDKYAEQLNDNEFAFGINNNKYKIGEIGL
jgi:hypothetical protein